MKCLETEKLISYACRLMDEPAASQVRAHLRECPRCGEIVKEYGRLDAVLNEWAVAEPTPGFDARVRQAVEAKEARRAVWGFQGWQWTRGLAVASLGALVVAGLFWFTYSHLGPSHPSQAVTRQPQSAHGAPTSPRMANLHSPAVPAHTANSSAPVVPGPQSVGVGLNDDKDAQALEDYDLAANFDLLSELPKGEPRVVN